MKLNLSIWLIGAVLCASHVASFAGERDILNAIRSGDLKVGSEVAIPEEENAAPPLPGDQAESLNMLYGLTRAQVDAITNKAFPLMPAIWPFGVVFVCWENPTVTDERERRIVREAIAETWEKYSALEFIGSRPDDRHEWQRCTPGFQGVRILINDEGPHVKFLGKYLAYDSSGNSRAVPNGMVLNFTFNNWSPACKSMLDFCIKGIAAHEFGHAIGFAHEQNRPDTPADCDEAPQGTSGDTMLTPWDDKSVMNYCNDKYNNGGQLSEFDQKAVAFIYGKK